MALAKLQNISMYNPQEEILNETVLDALKALVIVSQWMKECEVQESHVPRGT